MSKSDQNTGLIKAQFVYYYNQYMSTCTCVGKASSLEKYFS